jgi:hypothetical protein
MERGQVVLVDTNIIIEAVRIKCWSAVTGQFQIETVEKCCEEARTGDLHRPGYVQVSETALRTRLTVHPVSKTELANLALQDAESFRLDAGERHLWAQALGRHDDWRACCCDHAAVNAAIRLDWQDRLVSLEELIVNACGKRSAGALKDQFRTVRLSAWRTEALLKQGFK